MKLVNGCAQEPQMEATKAEAEPQPVADDGRTPTPQLPVTPVENNVTPTPTDPALEFSLVIKPKGTPVFRLSALYKGRLQGCITLHIILFLVMCTKLSEDILDRMDIFILELEELYIPKPLLWEYLWTASIIFAFIGLKAISKTNLSSMNSYAAGTILFGICPLFWGGGYFFYDIWEYAEKKSEAEIEKWQGYPIALYVYGFIVVAFQVHMYSLYFAAKLIKLWRAKVKKH